MLTDREFTDAAEHYLDMVYRIALNWYCGPADAEDAAQNTMLRLWRTETDFADDQHLRRWLARVTGDGVWSGVWYWSLPVDSEQAEALRFGDTVIPLK